MNHKKFMDIERLKPTFADGFQKGDYKQLTFKAELVDGHHLIVKVTDDKGEDQIDFGMIKVEVLHAGYTYKSSGDIAKGITVNL